MGEWGCLSSDHSSFQVIYFSFRTEIVNCSLGWQPGRGRIAVNLWEPITPDFTGQWGCGFIAGRINPNAGTAKGKNWSKLVVLSGLQVKLNWSEMRVLLFSALCLESVWSNSAWVSEYTLCIRSVGDVIPDTEHVLGAASHLNLHSLWFCNFSLPNLFLLFLLATMSQSWHNWYGGQVVVVENCPGHHPGPLHTRCK